MTTPRVTSRAIFFCLFYLLEAISAQLSPAAIGGIAAVIGGANLAANVPTARPRQVAHAQGALPGLDAHAGPVNPLPVLNLADYHPQDGPTQGTTATTSRPPPTTTLPGYLVGSPYPFVLPPPDIPYFGSKWNGPWGYPLGHYQAFRGTGQYITHYSYYPLSYFGSLMAPFAYGVSGKK
ncbi:hypothetical protein BV898_09696 [Hypsibius exemplaris]|uniref:Uncharacterized protein n=1 Tax=Hypsibius exemplaris TaxID=2072580 RepID=A0A1W0WM09_HYPEX|nr:hypothetical protein BV898_09696 [Hypsibius exemplaris]